MKYQIIDNFKRIGLHDSYFSDIKFEKDSISINLAWGFIENFIEENIVEPIVFGEARLQLNGIQAQTFKRLTDKKSIEIEKPTSIQNNSWLVMTNELTVQINYSTFMFMMTNDFGDYIEWTINFKKGQLNWDKFILHKNWLSGKETLS